MAGKQVPTAKQQVEQTAAGSGTTGATDPMCGVRLTPGECSHSTEYKKRRYFFCSDKCRAEFEEAAQRIRWHEAAKAGALFTHGKVRWGLA